MNTTIKERDDIATTASPQMLRFVFDSLDADRSRMEYASCGPDEVLKAAMALAAKMSYEYADAMLKERDR